MSESDSDLEFESADEDTEQDCSEKCETVSNPKKDSEKEITALENLSIEEKVEKESSRDKNSVPSSETKEQELRVKPCVEKEVSSDVNSEVERSNEKQRVTLRLEKKLQKKNSSKESSVEKVSDVDNTNTSSSSQPLSSSAPSSEAPPPSQTPPENKAVESSWGSWGSSLITTFTSQVSQGIGTVLETVESGLGVPAPEQLASRSPPSPDDTESKDAERRPEEESGSSLLGDLSSWTRALENTGSKLLYGGLDTLELIGKKTIDILTEGDPGLRNKRAAISEHLTLSQILREAKEQASQTSAASQDEADPGRPVFSQLLEDYLGLQHLEALEMLSKQSLARLRRMKDATGQDSRFQESAEEIKSICADVTSPEDSTESEDFETVVRRHILQMDLPFGIDSLLQARKRPKDLLEGEEQVVEEPEEVYRSSLHCLALFTARCMETFHKLAELLLVQPNHKTDAVEFATHLSGLAAAMCAEVDNLTSAYQKKLEFVFAKSSEANATETVTNLYVEAENSTWYIENTFQLLVPILQERALSVAED